MTDNNQLLHKIGTLIDQKLEPIKKDMATKADTEPIKNKLDAQGTSIAQINTTLGQVKTLVEATAAGQKEQATKTDIHKLEQKIDKVMKHVKNNTSRIENLEEHTDIPNPHKN
jgi:hypothetical protein